MREAGRDRVQPVDLADLTPAQQEVAARIESTRGHVAGPFSVLLHVPELAERVQHLGAFLRYDADLGRDVAELGVLVTAREWRCLFEWVVHEPLALAAGVPAEVIHLVWDGAGTDSMPPRYQAVVAYTRELARPNRVSDAAYQTALKEVGVEGMIELTALVGYYTMLAMTLNAHAEVASQLPESSTVTSLPR